MDATLAIPNLHKDFIASCLNVQSNALKKIIENIESPHGAEQQYVVTSLKQLEKDLRKLRKFLSE